MRTIWREFSQLTITHYMMIIHVDGLISKYVVGCSKLSTNNLFIITIYNW